MHGNDGILEAACSEKGGLQVLAVTVLTSLDRGDLRDLGPEVLPGNHVGTAGAGVYRHHLAIRRRHQDQDHRRVNEANVKPPATRDARGVQAEGEPEGEQDEYQASDERREPEERAGTRGPLDVGAQLPLGEVDLIPDEL